ncbi:hypothetical protein ACO02O_08035 [Dirofilaria immitis]
MCIRNLCAQCVCNSHYLSQLAAFFIDPRANSISISISSSSSSSSRSSNNDDDDVFVVLLKLDNDPSAGSPTETLLRLLPGSSHCD